MSTESGLPPLIPPIGTISQADRMFRVNWVSNLDRSPSGVPLHEPEFVSRQGRGVRLVDVRDADELTGPLGYIPGSDWVPREHALTLVDRLDPLTPVILVSRGGERSAQLAAELEHRGMRMVASMRGGMIAWRALGFASTREGSLLERRDVLGTATGVVERPPGALTAAEIEAHVGDPRSTRWLKLAAILLHGRQACVDGRDDSSVIGTPGGDAGEFVLGLAALERLAGRSLAPAVITELLRRRLDTFGRFYMHTDITAGNALIAAMRADARLTEAIGTTFEALEWRDWILSPPRDVRPIVFEHMCKTDNVGCGHLRLMMQHPDQYEIRDGLVLDFFRAFFDMRWAGAVEMDNVVLPGGHQEGAVVNVRLDADLHAYTWIPLVSPACGGTQMFVNHPQVSAYVRRQIAAFFVEQADLVGDTPLERETLTAEIESLAARQMSATLGHLAHGLPIYDLTFGRDGHARIQAAGVVG